MQIIKVEGGQLPTASMCLHHAELWTGAIHFHKEGTQRTQGKSHWEALWGAELYGGTNREAVKMGGMEHFIYPIHFRAVEQQRQTPSLTFLLTSNSFYAALEVCFKL